MPRFAANLSMMFGEWPFLDRFAAAAEAGFGAVEFLFPYEHAPDVIASRLRRCGLELALFNAPPGDWGAGERGLAALPERRSDFEASIGTALRYVEATGGRRLHVMAGNAAAGDSAAQQAYEGAVRFACDRVADAGVTIVIEPINGRDMPGYFLNDFRTAADLIRRLGRDELKLQFDVYHRQIIQGDVIRGLESLMPIIGHVQIAAVPERHEPGTGELDDERIFATLDRLDYSGFVGCEYHPAAATMDGLDWFRPHAQS